MPWYGSHSYLNEFILENRCRKILEIGVYNGENARSMVEAALQSVPSHEVEYYGFDFFSNYSTSRVGRRLDETSARARTHLGDEGFDKQIKIYEVCKSIPELRDMMRDHIDEAKDKAEKTLIAINDWKKYL